MGPVSQYIAGGVTLVFIRHGETDWNVEARLQGQQDIPLNETGRAQARRNGMVLSRDLPDVSGFDFVASPLGRAHETMVILRGAMGLEPRAFRTDPALLEITFGVWEGLTLAEIDADGSVEARRRQADKWGYVPPRGESYAMLAERVVRWLGTIGRDTVAVSHGAVGRVVQGLLLGFRPEEIPNLPIPQDRMFIYRDGAHEWH
ncbi:MAG: histidine phosphatase family protein [Bauldia sp.]|nr:histidine phosphatase family protein [Bauldia sp.]